MTCTHCLSFYLRSMALRCMHVCAESVHGHCLLESTALYAGRLLKTSWFCDHRGRKRLRVDHSYSTIKLRTKLLFLSRCCLSTLGILFSHTRTCITWWPGEWENARKPHFQNVYTSCVNKARVSCIQQQVPTKQWTWRASPHVGACPNEPFNGSHPAMMFKSKRLQCLQCITFIDSLFQ